MSFQNKLPSDYDLVILVKNGDISAFELIMRRFNQRLFRLARSIVISEDEAQDVLQESYIKAFYNIDQFRGPEGFASWLSRITSNEAFLRLRKNKQMMEYLQLNELENHEELLSPERQPMEKIADMQLRKVLENAVDKLPLDYRCVYVLRAVQQLSTEETAASLDISEDLVKTRFLRAKRKLRNIFEHYAADAGLEMYEFAGHRCDNIVTSVMERISVVSNLQS